jgi:ABC-type antimicrobial peptide transport system permease subunit
MRINGQPMRPLPPASGDREREDDRGFLFGQLSGYDLAAGDTPPTISIVAGRPLGPPDAGTNHVLVRSMLLGPPYFLQPGDTVTLKETGTGRIRTVNIVGFFSRPRRTRGLVSFFIAPVIGDRALAQALGGADAQTVAALQVASSQVDADAVALQRAVPGAFIVNIGDLTALVENILSELLQLLSVITVLVLGAGLAVVANGVALAMFERRREIALFKAIGFGPGSVLRMVLLENALVGLLAGTVSVLAAALILGVISRLAFQKAIGFDPVVALWVLIAAAFLAVVTAYLAARTPVRIRPLEALRNE